MEVSSAKMKFTKTETEYNLKSMKFLLMTITAMFAMIGVLMIILGLSIYGRYHDFTFLVQNQRLVTPSILFVFLGFSMFVMTCFGFFGSLKESTCMVNAYACILFVVVIFQLAIVCLCFTTSTKNLISYIDIPVDKYSMDAEIEADIDMLQIELNCCGSMSYLDYIGQDFHNNHSTAVATSIIDGDTVSVVVPSSCCVQFSNSVCHRLRSTGCKIAMVNAITQHSSVIGVMGISGLFVQILGISFALLLARLIRKAKSERTLLNWREMEKQIMSKQQEDEIPSIYMEYSTSSKA